MVELLRRVAGAALQVSAQGPGNRAQEARWLPDGDGAEAGARCVMLSPQIRCVGGIDVAKQAHVVCALAAPSGALRHRASRIEASAQGSAQGDALVRSWLATWGAPESLLVGMEATGPLREPLHDALARAGYTVLLLNPRQTAAWAAGLGRRAKADGIDAHTLARGVWAGLARASALPTETVQAPRALTRARRDVIEDRTAARQRLHDELVVLFPELVRFLLRLPGRNTLAAAAVLDLLLTYPSAHAVASAGLPELATTMEQVRAGRRTPAHAEALETLARRSTASSRAVAARSLVARALARHLLELRAPIADSEGAIAELLANAAAGQRRRAIPGIGPRGAATIRAELGEVSRFGAVDDVVA